MVRDVEVMLGEDNGEIHEVDTQYATQETRKLECDLKIEQCTFLTNKYLSTLPILG